MIEIVSSNTEADLKRRHAEWALAWPMRKLTANLLRVLRGGGKSYEIIPQLADVTQALREYRDAFGHFPTGYELERAFDLYEDDPTDPLAGEASEWECGKREIVRGSLQIAASLLVEQRAQERMGEREMLRGLETLEDIRERNRRARSATAKATSSRRPTRRRKPKGD